MNKCQLNRLIKHFKILFNRNILANTNQDHQMYIIHRVTKFQTDTLQNNVFRICKKKQN